MTRVFVDSIANHPDLLKMEMHSQLEVSQASREFFLNRWKSFTDYIEFNLEELHNAGLIEPINVKAAALMYQAMIREALLLKCLKTTDQFQEISLDELVNELIKLFLTTITFKK